MAANVQYVNVAAAPRARHHQRLLRISQANTITITPDTKRANANQSVSEGRGKSSHRRAISTGTSPGPDGNTIHAAALQWEQETCKSV
jgi:hypothetical protein